MPPLKTAASTASTRFPFPLGMGRVLPAGGRTAIMGVLNATPDSFSDGGRWGNLDAAVAAARAMAAEGANLVDVGGESTRPGAAPVGLEEELRRVVPLVRALVERVGLPVSVDTTKAAVFREAAAAGAAVLNDVSGLSADPELGAAAAAADAAVILMHRRGDPRTMSSLADYADFDAEIAGELRAAVARALNAGIVPARIALDPGVGFAKSAADSFRAVARVDVWRLDGFPLLVGPSRKSFLGAATGRTNPAERDVATAVVVAALARRGVECVRVHAVAAARDAVLTASALAAAEDGA
jgi:dihydropteroate synthase